MLKFNSDSVSARTAVVRKLARTEKFYNQNKLKLLGPNGGWRELNGRYTAHSRLGRPACRRLAPGRYLPALPIISVNAEITLDNVAAWVGTKPQESPLTLERALDSLYSGALDSGFEGVGYTFVPAHQLELCERRPPVMGARTGPEIAAGWPQRYLKQQLYRFDPVAAACRRTTLPVWWGEEAERTFVCDAQTAATAGQVNLLRRCVRETGVRAGVSVPLHSPSGGYGYVVFISRLALHEIRRGTAQEDHLLGLAHRFHNSLPHSASVALPDINLSARELECLQLLGRGRTLDEIAVLVGISFGTVRFHLRNACSKLGVTNRLQALSKASYLGLIQQECGRQRLDLDT